MTVWVLLKSETISSVWAVFKVRCCLVSIFTVSNFIKINNNTLTITISSMPCHRQPCHRQPSHRQMVWYSLNWINWKQQGKSMQLRGQPALCPKEVTYAYTLVLVTQIMGKNYETPVVQNIHYYEYLKCCSLCALTNYL